MPIFDLVPKRVFITWGILVTLSILAPIVGVEGEGSHWGVVIVLALALIKVRFVGLDFMELRHAPVWARMLFEVYCVGLFLLLLSGLY